VRLHRLITASLLALPLSFFAGTAGAAAVTGAANIAGSVTVTNTSINFNPSFTSTTGAMETGSFAGLTGGSIVSLTGGPTTGTVNVPNFITFSQGVASPITFDLTYIAPGVGSLAACGSSATGAMCTPTGSPFTLFQLSSNTVVASLQVNGDAYTQPKSTGFSNATGVFSTQFVMNGTIPGILAQLQSTGGINTTYSASFTASPVPEPASMLMMGLGLVGAGLIARRKVRN
jgi:PEP-CTERM motif